ncbi:MAG TPA: molybdate ABC transporter substrate-binding protein [Bacillales bacterium]|nr:molybdate ABC transporter substrate-binding protein [Bacillales bacterium]
MKRFTIFMFTMLLVFTMTACSNGQAAGDEKKKQLTLFAAASLTEAFNEMADAFEKQTGADVSISFAGTQVLRTQIEQGAQPDVFASANIKHMQAVKKEGFVSNYETFAYNSLVLIVPKNNPAHITRLKDLASKNLKLVIGVKKVPIGIYTRKMLTNAAQSFGASFKSEVLNHVVSMETNVKQVVKKVTLGEADAGIVYDSDVTNAVDDKVKTIKIPDDFDVKASYTIAVLNKAGHPDLARKWLDFVTSDKGQAILKAHHFAGAHSS